MTFTTRRPTSTAAAPCSGCCWTSTAAWRWPWPPTTPAWAAWTAGCRAGEYSHDGETLHTIPYPETEAYVDRVKKARDVYRRLYGQAEKHS